ncbi:hypothetical protein QJS04_geneDACA000099 [Acorus gramineus]|uniref:Vacuolar protein sorting-associated protein 62 n=1 Tax=Acorus gramineus TaxID=55184 RepID=A0AAV9ANS8_ACOGR|nr:hypothetical protein QJS04_geneDACA000099 [Acorus gramineus]
MIGWSCFCWNRISDVSHPEPEPEPEPFHLPFPMPQWPEGGDFSKGRIRIGELEVLQVTKFQCIWNCNLSNEKGKGFSFYKPVGIPDGFFCLGHYGQRNIEPLRGFLLVAREINSSKSDGPALMKPLNYVLLWSAEDHNGCGYFWLPCPPEGYKTMGFLITDTPEKPSLEEVRCVRADLTETCEAHNLVLDTESAYSKPNFRVWDTRPCNRGMWCKGLSIGTFFCSTDDTSEDLSIACLKNLDMSMKAMPNLDQVHSLIKHYGPTVYFHPKEVYLPSSVPWFFKNGAALHRRNSSKSEPVDANGSNLPQGGKNDGKYWIDLPHDDRKNLVRQGDLESAKLYVHVKPALGGTFTDIAMWVFCPFNGPATLKIGVASLAFSKVGRHVGDWEHFTLRVNNFTGELWSMYFSQHSGGVWVDAFDLEYVEGNRSIVYSSRNGHASFPHPGDYLQGSQKLGIGVRNDAARSDLFMDSSVNYEIMAAEYLGDGVVAEPGWLQYMREWGPTIVYNSRSELEKMIRFLPVNMRSSVENLFDRLPVELYGEEGPTGPKEKNNWVGDERS